MNEYSVIAGSSIIGIVEADNLKAAVKKALTKITEELKLDEKLTRFVVQKKS